MIRLTESNGDLVILSVSSEQNSFSITNQALVSEAVHEHARSTLAIAVWDGRSRGSDDATAEFVRMAAEAGMKLTTVLTC
jgi:hypothetical protein